MRLDTLYTHTFHTFLLCKGGILFCFLVHGLLFADCGKVCKEFCFFEHYLSTSFFQDHFLHKHNSLNPSILPVFPDCPPLFWFRAHPTLRRRLSLVGRPGIEPGSVRLKVWCITLMLTTRLSSLHVNYYDTKLGDFQGKLVDARRIELPTQCLQGIVAPLVHARPFTYSK